MSRINDAYHNHLRLVNALGRTVGPRGLTTKEVLNMHFIYAAEDPVITLALRAVNYNLMVKEASWILGGRNDIFHERMRPYSDDGRHLSGAYGPRFVTQLPYVTGVLKRDLQSRRAVISFWETNPDPASKDIPCTLTYQFLVRDDEIHGRVSMRSSDAWLGIPYDSFSFAMMLNYVRLLINPKLGLGEITISIGSAHIYDTNYKSIERLVGDNKAYDADNEFRIKLCSYLYGYSDPVNFRKALDDLANEGIDPRTLTFRRNP